MKLLEIFACMVVALAAKLDKKPIAIVSSTKQLNPDASYSFAFESADGPQVEKSRKARQVGPKPKDLSSIFRVFFSSYVDPDGRTIQGDWTADENGFRAMGNHLPVASPIE